MFLSSVKLDQTLVDTHFWQIFELTGSPCTRQTKAKMAKSRILAKLGWVDQLIGGVDHTKYFCPEVTLIGVRAHPIFELTKKN